MTNYLDLAFYVTGTAQPKLTQANLNKIPVPFPPLDEQRRIVSEVEERFSTVQILIDYLKSNQKKASLVRQSILKCAFERGLDTN